MSAPHEVLTQLLSPAQADTLSAAGRQAWEEIAGPLKAMLSAAPSLVEVDGRLVMPDEVAGEFEARHLVAPLEVTTDKEQSALAYLAVPTRAAALFFDSQADDPDDEEQQTIVVTSTILGQVIGTLNSRVFGNSPSGLVLSLDDMVASSMPSLLSTLDEPALFLTATLMGERPLPLTFFFPGTFLDIVAAAMPETPASRSEPSPFSLTDGDLDAAELIHQPAPEEEPVQVMAAAVEPTSRAAREPTPISQAPAAHRARFAPLPDPEPAARRNPIDLLAGLQMNVSVELGRTDLTVAEVLELGPGSVIELDRLAGEPVDILVNDRLVARGEVVVVDENFGVRVVEVVRRGVEQEERVV